MNKQDLLVEFYQKKNYEALKHLLAESKDTYEQQILARVFLEQKDYQKAAYIYSKLGMLYEFGRCELLMGRIDNTKEIWKNIKEETPATKWGTSLLEFISLYVVNIPTFFQIRAFLEADLDAILNAGLITYAENIANGAHLFAQNNQESYKFIGRVFVNNNYFDLAEIFLYKAKDLFYIDPEVHFLIAKCFLQKGKRDKAIESLEISIEKGFGYYPARKFLEEIKSME